VLLNGIMLTQDEQEEQQEQELQQARAYACTASALAKQLDT
jgi:hypothetical protein